MPSEAYDAAKLAQIKSATVTRMYGSPLDDLDQLGLADQSRRDSRFAVQWCLCVQDSPESPCLCRPVIVWLGRLDVVSYGKTVHKDQAGESLYFFDLKNDATLLLERVQPISAAVVKKIASLSHRDVDNLLAASTTLAGLPFGGATTIAQMVDPSLLPVLLDLLLDALGELAAPIDWQQLAQDYIHRHHG